MISYSRLVFLILVLALFSCGPQHKQAAEIVVENKIAIVGNKFINDPNTSG